MAPRSQSLLPTASPLLLDTLYCEEDGDLAGYGFDDDCVETENDEPLAFFENDLFWDDDELGSLLSKELEQTRLLHLGPKDSYGYLMVARKEAVEWMLRANAYYGFAAVTAVLAVNYFDRFVSSLCLQRDKPWMGQLAAVACLSLAAKVEETQVPLLQELQVEESKFVFDAKTVQRMELFVLSNLQWKMNPVTPFSFIDHVIRRFRLQGKLQREFLERCGRFILSVISDSIFRTYPSSVMATATMLLVIKQVDPCNALGYENQLMDILQISKEKTDDCYHFIADSFDDYGCHQFLSCKRKRESAPGSPNAVIDGYFSCDSSNDSWTVASSVSSSPEPPYKMIKAQHEQIRLAPLDRLPVDMLGSPY